MLINFLVQMLQSTETLLLNLFCSWKYEQKTSKVAYFSKLAAQIAQRVAFILSNVAYMPTVYKTELIPNET